MNSAALTTATIRVAYVLRAFPRLSETFILNEILGLLECGVDVRIFALERVPGGPTHPAVDRIARRVHWIEDGDSAPARRLPKGIPSRHRKHWTAGLAIGRLLAADPVSHVHAHFAGPAATAAAAAAERARVPFTFTAHAKDIFTDRVDWEWIRELSRRAAAVVTVCEYNRRFLRRKLGADARLVKIYNGVDLDRWTPRRTPLTRVVSSTRASGRPGGSAPGAGRNAPKPQPLRILGVGRLVRKKGFHVLLEAAAKLSTRGIDARVTLVGDGAESGRLREQARELGLGRRARFRGALTEPEVRRLLRAAHAVVLPCVVDRDGNQDALPTVLLEAGACGIPAVSTPVAGIPEIVLHGRTGLLVPSDDAGALARALARLASSAARRARLGSAARRHIESRFDRRIALGALTRLFGDSRARENSAYANFAALS